MATKRRKPRPVSRAGLWGASAYSPFFLLLRDQIRVKLSPSGSSNRLAKMGAVARIIELEGKVGLPPFDSFDQDAPISVRR